MSWAPQEADAEMGVGIKENFFLFFFFSLNQSREETGVGLPTEESFRVQC